MANDLVPELSNEKNISILSISNLSDSVQKKSRLSLMSSSNNNLNGQNSNSSSTVSLHNQQQKDTSFKKTDGNLLKCKAVKTYQTTQPNHLSFDVNETIIITNNSAKELWVQFLFI